MAYSDQALLSQDQDFLKRLASCAAVEVPAIDPNMGPVGWASRNIWQIAAAPGFADDYASALAAGVERPGNDPAVISDEELRAAVQTYVAAAP